MIFRAPQVVLLSLMLMSGCSSLLSHFVEPPKIEKKELHVESVSFQKIDLSLDLLIENPNRMNLPLENLNAVLEVNDQPFLSKAWNELPVLKGKEKTLVKLPLSLEWKQILNVGLKMTQLHSIPYHLKGSVRVKGFELPFEEKGELSLKP